VPKPGGDQHQSGVAIREGAHHTRAPADLADDPLKWVVGPQLPPMGRGIGVIGERFAHVLLHQTRGRAQLHLLQPLHDFGSLCLRRFTILLGMDRLQHARDICDPAVGHVAEDVPIPVHHTTLPVCMRQNLVQI
jgi:hypothetical protein